VGRIWKSLGRWTREILQCYKQSLVGSSDGYPKDQNAHRNVDREGQVHEISDGSEGSIWSCTTGHLCHILTKDLSVFCPCPGTLHEAKLKGH
jgi:hypothetical protein